MAAQKAKWLRVSAALRCVLALRAWSGSLRLVEVDMVEVEGITVENFNHPRPIHLSQWSAHGSPCLLRRLQENECLYRGYLPCSSRTLPSLRPMTALSATPHSQRE